MYPNPIVPMRALLPTKPKVATTTPVAIDQTEVHTAEVAVQQREQDPLVTFARAQARLDDKDGLKDRMKAMGLKLDMGFLEKDS